MAARWSWPASGRRRKSCGPRSSIAWSCLRGSSSVGSPCRPVATLKPATSPSVAASSSVYGRSGEMSADTADPQQAGPANPTAPPSPPSDAFIVVPVRNMVLFPELVTPITIGRTTSIAAVQQAVRDQRQIVVALQRDPEKAEVGPEDLHGMGVVANILRYITASETEHHVVCQGVQRFRIGEYVGGWPFPVVRGLHIPEPADGGTEIEARFLNLKQQVLEILDLIPQVPPGLREVVAAITR